MDDYGMGSSTLKQLHEIRFDILKPDRFFVSRIGDPKADVNLLYHVGMLYMYLYTMPAEEALRLAGFERYACSIMVLAAGRLIMGQ